jgi:integrase
MSRALTARTIETIKPGPNREEIPDPLLPGHYLVLQPSGARSFAVRYRLGVRSRKYTVGPYPAIDLKTARALAAKALRAVAEGRDPGQEKIAARAVQPDTVEAVAKQFVELHCRRANRPRTIEGTQQLLDLHVLPRWRRRLIKDITRRDLLDLLDGMVESGRPVAANRALTAVRKLFNWAMERDIVASSPCAGVKPPTPEQSRDRVLSDDELRDIWLAADRLGGPYAALIKLLMLTGQRRDEVARMTWREVELEARLWTLPKERSKNGQPHDIPLSDPAVAILEALPRIGDTFVLTTDGKSAASNYGANKRQLDALLPADMPPWWLHDLRRTAASGMARLGINLPVIEKVLNHSSGSFGGIVGVYQRHDFADEKRHALERWGAHVADLISGRRSRRNVVRLETRA